MRFPTILRYGVVIFLCLLSRQIEYRTIVVIAHCAAMVVFIFIKLLNNFTLSVEECTVSKALMVEPLPVF